MPSGKALAAMRRAPDVCATAAFLMVMKDPAGMAEAVKGEQDSACGTQAANVALIIHVAMLHSDPAVML